MKHLKSLFILFGLLVLATAAHAQATYLAPPTTTTYPSSAPYNTAGTAGIPLYSKSDGALYVDFLDQQTVLLGAGSSTIGSVNQAGAPWSFSASSLPLPTGAATSAYQSAVESAPGTSQTVAITVQGNASGIGLPVTGTFWQTTQPISASALPLPSGAAQDSSVNGLLVAQGSSTASQKGTLGMGAVTTSSPSDTNSQTAPFSLTTGGALRVDASATTQPVSLSSQPLPTGASTSALQSAVEGTAGTPTTAVLTVQGVSGGTAIPISGTVTTTISGVAQDSHLTNVQSAPGTAQTVAVTIQGNSSSVAVPVSAASLPLPSGAATAANQTSVIGSPGSPTSAVLTVQGNASGTAMPVSAASLPLPSGAATATNQTSVQSSVGTSATTAITIQGSGSGVAVPVSLSSVPTHAVTQSGTWSVVNSAGTNSIGTVGLNAGSNTIGGVTLQSAVPAGTNSIGTVGLNAGTNSIGTVAINAAIPAGTNSIGTVQIGNTPNTTPILVTQIPATQGGNSAAAVLSAASTNLTSIKSSAGQVFGYQISDTNTYWIYVKFFNLPTGSITVGTTSPVLTIGVPPGGSVTYNTTNGWVFSADISYCITKNSAATDATAVAAGDAVGVIEWH